MDKLYEIWTEPVELQFREYEGVAKESPFIGELSGEFFFPNKQSRNKRFYSDKLWEETLNSPRTKDLMERRVLGGTIGHVDKDTDTLLREGELGYILTELKKDNGKGVGKALVLNNEVGRRLKLYYKAGMKLGTSTIGDGKVLETNDDGVEIIDPKSYKLERIDLVVLPAFTPEEWMQLKESLVKEYGSGDKVVNGDPDGKLKEGIDMDLQKMLEEVTKEKKELETEVLESHKKIVNLESENEKLKKDLEDLMSKYEGLKKYEGANIDLEKVAEQDKLLETYQELGTPDEIKEALQKSEEMLEKLSELGTIDEIEEALQKAKDFISKVEELGSLPEIEEALQKSEEFIQNSLEERNKEVAESLSAKYGVSVAHVTKLIESVGDVETIEEMLSELVPGSGDGKGDDEGKKRKKEEKTIEPRAGRIIASMIK